MGDRGVTGPVTLRIASTWDGARCEPGDVANLSVTALADGLHVAIDAPAHGDPPPAAPPGPTWALWEHEVVELFVLGPDERYTELEVGPHGHHLLLRLEGRRNAVEKLLPLDVAWARANERWRATVHLPASVLPPRPWRLNAYAIHGVGPARRYLAWAPVPGPAPDFHRLEHFRAVPELG